MVDKCRVKYRLSKLYGQFNDIQSVKCSCVNEMRLFRKKQVFNVSSKSSNGSGLSGLAGSCCDF